MTTRQLGSLTASLLAALTFASPAAAAPFTPELDRAYRTAVRFWGETPSECTSLDREIVDDAAMPEGAEGWASIPDKPAPCVLYLARSLAAPRLLGRACGVLAHERGHLLGFEHSADPGNIMFPSIVGGFIPATCERLELRELNRRERR